MRLPALLLLVAALSGCVTPLYRETSEGKFIGALDVRWVKNDYFLFLPDEDDPLTFKRSNGKAIRPGPIGSNEAFISKRVRM
jgi:hypothetical protein